MFENCSVEFRALVKTLALIVIMVVCEVASVAMPHSLVGYIFGYIFAMIAGGLAGYLGYMVYQVILDRERLNQK